MGRIVIHAGRPKAGSTSVQDWLADNAEALQARGVLVAHGVLSKLRDVVRLRAYTPPRQVHSGDIVSAYLRLDDPEAHLRRFLTDLDELAASSPTVVVTSENFANLLEPPDERFLAGLDDLGRRHTIEVVLYVRPQHESLVSAWAQWGYRGHRAPAAYVRHRARTHHYLRTLDEVRRRAPHIEVVIRPFRRDLFTGGGLIADFATAVLGVDGDLVEERWVNTSLPLDLANLLRAAPDGTFWTSDSGPRSSSRTSGRPTKAFRAVLPLLERWEVEESAQVVAGRDVVHRWAHHRFEEENQQLVDRLGWDTAAFIPPPAAEGSRDLDQLDDLWRGDPSTPSGAMVLLAVDALGEARHEIEVQRTSKGVVGRLAGPESKGRDTLRRIVRR